MKILFTTDGSQGSAHALDVLCDLPLGRDDHVTVLSVPVRQSLGLAFDGAGGVLDTELLAAEEEHAKEVARGAAHRLTATGVSVEAETADDGSVPTTIMSYLGRRPTELVVVGSRGRGNIIGALLGSTARALARHAPVPVLVVRGRREAPRRILAAVDGSVDSDAAVEVLTRLPLPAEAEITCLYVTPDRRLHPTLVEEAREAVARAETDRANAVLERAATTLGGHRTVGAMVADRGHVAEQVLARADAMGADLIVLGSRGQTLGRGFLQGSVADRVLSEAHCAVLVAKPVISVAHREPERQATGDRLGL